MDSANHMPSYKTFRVFTRSTIGWKGDLPAGSIVMATATATGWSWVDNGSSYYIMIASAAGNTGGGTYHYHGMTASLANYGSTECGTVGGSVTSMVSQNHAHNAVSFNASNSDTYNYYKLGLGIIKNSSEDYVKKDFYLLFDGDPGAGWEADANTGRFLGRSSDGSLTTSGSYVTYTHNHGGSWSATSSTANSCINRGAPSSYYAASPPCSHTHSMSGTINNADATPAYVRLLLYKATKNFGNKPRAVFIITWLSDLNGI